MKKVKKLLAMIMAMTMVLGLGLTSFAKAPGVDGVYGTSDDSASISVKGIENEEDNENFEVTAYQIVKAKYNTSTYVFEGYESVYPAILDVATDTDSTSINFTQAELDAVRNYIETNGAVADTSYTMSYDSNEQTFKNDNVPVGSYLVVVRNAEAKVYNSAVVSSYYVVEEGENDLTEGSLDIKDEPSWIKVTDKPTVDKKVVGNEEDPTKGNSVNIGDTVTYTVEVDPIPYYGGDLPKLKVTDTLSAGLTYVQDSLTVKIGEETLTRDTDYKFEQTGQTLSVDFVIDGRYTLNSYAGSTVVITYQAVLNENAGINEAGNNNDVTLDYSVDSTTQQGQKEDSDKTYTYTFDINGSVSGSKKVLTKVGEDEDIDALGGATFTLYTDPQCTKVYENNIFTGTAMSDEEGQLDIKGLAEGTYYLKETTAPDGYSVNEHVFKIVIAATYDEVAGSATEGQLKNWTITIDDKATSTFTVTNDSVNFNVSDTEIKNTKLASLPSTGGIGTTIFTIGGCAIMIAAAALYFVNRRKSEEN